MLHYTLFVPFASLITQGSTAAQPDTGDGPVVSPFRWHSSDEIASNVRDAFANGTVLFNNRLRVEFADTTGLNSSTAITNRLRLGYETKQVYGFQGLIDFESVVSPAVDNYVVPPTGDGTPGRTVIADPIGTEVNRAQIAYTVPVPVDSELQLSTIFGRQRIVFDDSRFIGNVGWRQFEQTFDAVRFQTNAGVPDLRLDYSYVWKVQRVFGPDGPNWDSDSHLIHASYDVSSRLNLTGFAHLLDFQSSSAANSVNTYGVTVKGKVPIGDSDSSDLTTKYQATYARQTDAGQNPTQFDANFVAAEVSLSHAKSGSVHLGYQFLDSDGGNAAFRFPLGTNHKFQGFADQFLVTPAFGLQDLYVGANAPLPYDVKGAIAIHQFWSDGGGMDLGNELDAVLKRSFGKNVEVLGKAAFFNGHNGQPDTVRLWGQTTLSF